MILSVYHLLLFSHTIRPIASFFYSHATSSWFFFFKCCVTLPLGCLLRPFHLSNYFSNVIIRDSFFRLDFNSEEEKELVEQVLKIIWILPSNFLCSNFLDFSQQYYITLCYIILCCMILYHTMLYYIVLYDIILYYVILYCVVWYDIILCYIILCCMILYYIIKFYFILVCTGTV